MTKSKKGAIWLAGSFLLTALGYKFTTLPLITNTHLVLAFAVSASYIAGFYMACQLAKLGWDYFAQRRRTRIEAPITNNQEAPVPAPEEKPAPTPEEEPAPVPEDPVPVPQDPVPVPQDPVLADPVPVPEEVPEDPVPPTDPVQDPVPAPADPVPAPADPVPVPADPVPVPADPVPTPEVLPKPPAVNMEELDQLLKRLEQEYRAEQLANNEFNNELDPIQEGVEGGESDSDLESGKKTPGKGEDSDPGSPIRSPIVHRYRHRRNEFDFLGEAQELGKRDSIPVQRLNISDHKGPTYAGQVAIFSPKKP